MNVKKTKSSKKIVLKITMSMTDTLMDYLVCVWVRRSRLERHPATRWSRNILPSWSHIVAAG